MTRLWLVALLLFAGNLVSAADPPPTPNSAATRFERGEQLRLAGQWDAAIRELDEAIRLDPAHPAARASRGICWREKGDPKRALADLDLAILLDTTNPVFFHGRSAARGAMRDWPGAVEDLGRAIRLRPDDPALYEDRACIWARQGEWRRAADDCDAAVRVAPRRAKSWKLRGAALGKLGRDDEALADFDRASELDPLDVEAHTLRVEVLWRAQKWEQAVGACEKAKRLNVSTADLCAKCGVARVLSTGGDYTRALQDYDDALRLNPAYLPALNARALLRAACPDDRIRDAAKAEADARRAWELTGGKDGWAVSGFAAARAAAGRYDDAIKYQKQALGDPAYAAANGDEARARLKLYEAGEPYRLPTK